MTLIMFQMLAALKLSVQKLQFTILLGASDFSLLKKFPSLFVEINLRLLILTFMMLENTLFLEHTVESATIPNLVCITERLRSL
jgi:hypothetical protein